jgi:uncharacterized protein (TIGR00369 family)
VNDTHGLADQPDPENPGWFVWNLKDPTRFNGVVFGRMAVRRDADGRGRLRMFPERRNTNLYDNLHGGVLLALADVALFAAAYIQQRAGTGGAVTLDLTMQFLGSGKPGIPCDAVGEVLKETGRLVFGRGVVEQGGETIAAYSGTLRKLSGRSSPGGD